MQSQKDPVDPYAKKGKKNTSPLNEMTQVVRKSGGGAGSFREKIDPDGILPEEFFRGLIVDALGIPELKRYNLDDMPVDSTVVNFGMRRSGKSVLSRHILYVLKDKLPRAMVMSDTDDLNRFYRNYVPEKHIIKGVNKLIIKRLLDLQKKFMKKLLQEYGTKDEIPDEELNDVRVLIVADDVIQNENEIRYNPPLNTIFVNGRHYNIFFLLNTQYEKAIPPTMRNNVDIAFMFYPENRDAVDHLWRLFGSNMRMDMFAALLYKYTKNYCTLVSARSTITGSLALVDRMFWFKADKNLENIDFMVGENTRKTQRDYQFTPAVSDE